MPSETTAQIVKPEDGYALAPGQGVALIMDTEPYDEARDRFIELLHVTVTHLLGNGPIFAMVYNQQPQPVEWVGFITEIDATHVVFDDGVCVDITSIYALHTT